LKNPQTAHIKGILSSSDAKRWEWLHKDFILGMPAKHKVVQIKKYRQFVGKSDSEEQISFFEKAKLSSMLGGKK
jgi:hypothetical protein